MNIKGVAKEVNARNLQWEQEKELIRRCYVALNPSEQAQISLSDYTRMVINAAKGMIR